ncbi:MAG TPA: rhomboid family intramembrane serine protease [Longimicrobiales bacterium]|nr:rhomboid family intramembrane serine protease [Longimicrobiales bacterium]
MTPWVLRLLLANVVVYVLAQPGTMLYHLFMFVPAWVLQRPWTPVTYMFLHANLWHILFNMLGLYFFGPRLEARIGARDFVLLYVTAGLTGALLSFFFEFGAPIVGASGAIFGVLLGFAHFWPHERIYIWGILPVPARLMVIGFAMLSIYSGLSGSGAGIAHFAHLGGFAGAWAYLRIRDRRKSAFRRKATPDADPSPLDRISGRASRDEKRWEAIDVAALHEINRHEVERIREKIRERGSGSLSADERAFMNRMLS